MSTFPMWAFQQWAFKYENCRVTIISPIHDTMVIEAKVMDMIDDAFRHRRHELGAHDTGEGVFGIDEKGAYLQFGYDSPFRW